MLLGAEIAKRRKALGYSQPRFALAAGVPPRMIQYLEAGERWPMIPNLAKICGPLNVQLSTLLKEIGL
jgi:transcriptional regulator with XRE-family HTH domain